MKKGLLWMVFVSLVSADIQNGIQVYKTHCAGCHSITMSGGMGRDFNLVSYERKKEDIFLYIVDPAGNYTRFGYSSNAMPKIAIKPEEASDVAEYIDSLQKFKKWMKKN